ncbi:MAG: prolyl oligopeptidase family serine peptidase [Xanthomonadaceae bacterium]|nr:prolyl oligopeptidase family serine peptidase [Xanthomonadaceae bacterium]
MLATIRTLLLVMALATLGGCDRPAQPTQPGVGSERTAPPVTPAVAAHVPNPYPIEDFIGSTALSGASFSADESRILFSADRSGVWNAFTIPVAGGDWQAVTASETDNTFAVAFFPADDRILITRDQGGNERNHLYVIEADGSEHDLTPGKSLKASFLRFARDGSGFYVLSNERDPRYFDVYRYATAPGYARELIYRNDDGYQPTTVSEDARYVALEKPDTTNNNDLYVYDRTAKQLLKLSEHQGEARYAAQDFSPDGSHLLYTSNEGSEFSRLRRYNLADATHGGVEAADWDIAYAWYSQTGRYRVSGVNEDGSLIAQVFDTVANAAVPMPDLPAGDVRGVAIARSEQRMAFYLNGDRQPNDLYTLPIGGEPQALTHSLNPAIDPEDLVDSEVVRFMSFDGMAIPNILWRPPQADRHHKVPALVWVHGGPGGQTTRAHNALIQFLVNHGYVVLGINNRGSSGYGKTFYAADDGKHGREPLWDVVAARQYLQTLAYVDPDRIGIIGGSYGGYMVLSALTFQPEVFDVGVDLFGVANWIRTLENIPPWWESQRQALYAEIGNPRTQRAFLRETSPLFHADKIQRPLMVLQGANDPRVLKAESDDIVAAVRKRKVPVEYVVFADEGHGFTKKANQIEGYGKILVFLDKYLKGKAVAPSSDEDTGKERIGKQPDARDGKVH